MSTAPPPSPRQVAAGFTVWVAAACLLIYVGGLARLAYDVVVLGVLTGLGLKLGVLAVVYLLGLALGAVGQGRGSVPAFGTVARAFGWANLALASFTYLVIPFRYAAPRDYGASAYGAGVFVVALDRQGSFGLPLRPLAALPVSGHAAQIPSALGILFFEAGTWIPHFTEMPPGVYDVLEARARGYQVSARTPSRLVFVGH